MDKSRIEIEPPFGLKEKILKRIRYEKKILAIKRKIFVFSIGLAISIFTFIPALKLLINELNRTGFMKFFSLFSSDLFLVIKYWQPFAITLLESLPVVGLIAFFSVVFVLLSSLRYLSRNIVRIKLQKI